MRIVNARDVQTTTVLFRDNGSSSIEDLTEIPLVLAKLLLTVCAEERFSGAFLEREIGFRGVGTDSKEPMLIVVHRPKEELRDDVGRAQIGPLTAKPAN